MRLAVIDRTGDLGGASRTRAATRLARLSNVLDAIFETELEVSKEAARSAEPVYVVDIAVRFREPDLEPIRIRERGRELGKTLEVAIDHAEYQVAELKERLAGHLRHPGLGR